MKTKSIIASIVVFLAFFLNANFINAQDQEKTFLEETGETQDSTKMNDILDYDLEYGKQGPSTGLIIGIVAVVLVGGGIIYFARKKKK